MQLKEALLESICSEHRLTRDTIAAMTDGDMQFKATPVQMGFGQQALHLLSAHETLLDALQGKGWVWERGLTLDNYPTQSAILAKFDDVAAAQVAFFGDLAADRFMEMIPLPWGSPEPLFKLVVDWISHEAHHRGQMITYLRLKGMTPAKY